MAYDRYDRPRGGDRREERGFFERAGDEIASWFGGEEDERRRRDEERMNRMRDRGWSRDRDYGRDRFVYGDWGGLGGDGERDRYDYGGSGRDWDRDRERNRWSEEDRRASRPMNWTASNSDYRSGYAGYDRDYSPGGGYESGYGPARMRGYDYTRGYGASDYGAGSDRGYGSSGYGGAFTGSDYERDERRPDSNWERDEYRRTSYAGAGRDNDRHYQAWRQRQLNDLDRDYEMYNRERQERFESDFGAWRKERMNKRQHLGGIQEHMDVVGSDGETVGKVDMVRGDRVILTKSDSEDNRHHSFDCSLIDSVEGDQIRLQVPAEEAKSRLRDEERGFFGREGDTSLERSFSGTYTS
jgi:hypothetical protein